MNGMKTLKNVSERYVCAATFTSESLVTPNYISTAANLNSLK